MFGGAAMEIESGEAWGTAAVCADWRTIDHALRGIARRRAGLDAEEARWLREAEACQLWRQLGMVSAIDYMERVLGYAPRAAQDRLRVARALGALPRLTDALTTGALSFSAVRELTRVATPTTEAAWRDQAVGLNVRQVEELVADHKLGDRPQDPRDPEAHIHTVRFELSASTFARLRQARQTLESEHGRHLTDDECIAAMCHAVTDAPAQPGAACRDAAEWEPGAADPAALREDTAAGAASSDHATSGRARYQIAITVCERCRQGWQEGAGAMVAIDAATVDRALCDAQHIGSTDARAPDRAHQDIPPRVARLVWTRDHGRCRVPGCRSSRGIEIHHLTHCVDGGTHDASNLVLLCSSCHQAHHAGTLTVTGSAAHVEVRRASTPLPKPHAAATEARSIDAHVGAARPSSLEQAERRALAKQALVQLGWSPAIARRVLAEPDLDPAATLEQLIREALRRCPMSRS